MSCAWLAPKLMPCTLSRAGCSRPALCVEARPGLSRKELLFHTQVIGVPKRWVTRQSWLHQKLYYFFTTSRRYQVLQMPLRKLTFKPPWIRNFATARTPSRDRKANAKNKYLQTRNNENLDWWKQKMEHLKKPAAKELTKRLNYSNLLGLDDELRNGSFKEGSLNRELLEVKEMFPREVLLCRVGEFYEAVGFDACVLVEYAALNPMSGMRSDTVPRAGCPIMNLRQTLDALTLSGFSVCVYEEVKAPSQARQRKDRFVSGHAHPGSPYVYGLAEVDIDLEIPEEVYVVGISKSARGYCLVSVLEMMKTFSVEDGLTEEAVVAKLRAKTCYFIFLHCSLQDDPSGLVRWAEYGEGGLLWAECKGKSWEWFDQDPISQVLSKARTLYDLDVQEEFRKVVFPSEGRPRPLYIGTAAQIGVLQTVGVPSLLKVILPADCTGLCRAYLRDLLLNPPPAHVANSIQAACKLMMGVTSAIPDFTCVSAAKLVKLIGTKEANHIEFRRIRNMAEDIIWMDKDQQLSHILSYLLHPTSLATGLKHERQHLVKECRQLVIELDKVLATDEDPEQDYSSAQNIPDDFFQCMEYSWRGRIKRELAEKFYDEVDKAAESLHDAVKNDFLPILFRVRATDASIAGGAKVEIFYSREHQAVWLKLRQVSAVVHGTPEETLLRALVPAVDGKGKKIRDDLYTTANVEKALNQYKDAVQEVMWKVFEVLRSLAEDLKSKLNTIVYISVLGVIAKTLFGHVSESRRRGWAMPTLLTDEEQSNRKDGAGIQKPTSSGKSDGIRELVLVDLVPYWTDKSCTLAVPNTVIMSSLYLLTGPNGGGKSSLLRSIGAAALLGTCGLMVPASSAIIPPLDAVMLRMMPLDSPADGKSSFQMEMSELRTILVEATEKSLVLVDELCRGTEVLKGTAIAASVIEFLDAVGCTGVLSTHLHGLLDMDLKTEGLVYKCMGTRVENGVLKPTWKLEDGSCIESLAFETARIEGVPAKVVQRAEQLYLSYLNLHPEAQLKSDNLSEEYDEFNRIRNNHTLSNENCSGEVKKLLDPMFGLSKTEFWQGNVDKISSRHLVSKEEKDSSLNSGIADTNDFKQELDLHTSDVFKAAGGNTMALEDVEDIFSDVCRREILEVQRKDPLNLTGDIVLTRVGTRERPPPATTNCSCVYIMSRPDGKFYVGQTDNIAGRISAHRAKEGFKKAFFVYVQVANKSIASKLETLLINHLPRSGLELVNKADKHHRYFGTDAPQAQSPF